MGDSIKTQRVIIRAIRYSPILLDLADKDIANYLKVDMIKYKKRCNLV